MNRRIPNAVEGRVAGLAIAAALILLSTRHAAAQRLGWSGSVDASGTVLFGESSEQVAVGRLQLARADSTLEVRSDMQVRYAETRPDTEPRRVTGRAWLVSLGLDYEPFSRVSPFVFGTIESSLQLSIAHRTSAGAGAKYTFVRDGDAEASVSLALLAERTRALGEVTTDAVATRERWSARGRVRGRVGPTHLSHVTFYQPAIANFSRFTVVSTTTVAVDITKAVAFTVTLEELYDSEARVRGALRNSGGHLVFGVRASR